MVLPGPKTGADIYTALDKMAKKNLTQLVPGQKKIRIKLSTTYMIFPRRHVNLTKNDGSDMNLNFYDKTIYR